MDDVEIPSAVTEQLTATVAREVAEANGDQRVFPDRVVVDRPTDADRTFAGWPTPVLVIARENQGVCSWGVPLGDPNPPVLVGGFDLDEATGSPQTLVYAPDLATYIAVRRWDNACQDREPLLQAQAAVLDAGTLEALRARFREVLPTRGWPGPEQYRFESEEIKILLWSGTSQCDWWLSGPDVATFEPVVSELLALSDLRTSLWSNDLPGIALLETVLGA